MTFSPIKNRDYGSSKAAVARLFEQAGGVPAVQELLDLSRTRVYAFADPDSSNELSFARVAAITRETGAQAAAEYLALLAGGAFLPVAEAAEPGDWHAIAARASRKNARTISALLDALSEENESPGEVDEAEARRLLELVDQQIALLAFQRAKLMETLGETPAADDA